MIHGTAECRRDKGSTRGNRESQVPDHVCVGRNISAVTTACLRILCDICLYLRIFVSRDVIDLLRTELYDSFRVTMGLNMRCLLLCNRMTSMLLIISIFMCYGMSETNTVPSEVLKPAAALSYAAGMPPSHIL